MDFLVDGEHYIANPGDSWNIAGNVEHGATAMEALGRGGVFSLSGKIICRTLRQMNSLTMSHLPHNSREVRKLHETNPE